MDNEEKKEAMDKINEDFDFGKAVVTELQDMLDLAKNEIDWDDEDNGAIQLFGDDLIKALVDLEKVIYAIHGFNVWNNG